MCKPILVMLLDLPFFITSMLLLPMAFISTPALACPSGSELDQGHATYYGIYGSYALDDLSAANYADDGLPITPPAVNHDPHSPHPELPVELPAVMYMPTFVLWSGTVP